MRVSSFAAKRKATLTGQGPYGSQLSIHITAEWTKYLLAGVKNRNLLSEVFIYSFGLERNPIVCA